MARAVRSGDEEIPADRMPEASKPPRVSASEKITAAKNDMILKKNTPPAPPGIKNTGRAIPFAAEDAEIRVYVPDGDGRLEVRPSEGIYEIGQEQGVASFELSFDRPVDLGEKKILLDMRTSGAEAMAACKARNTATRTTPEISLGRVSESWKPVEIDADDGIYLYMDPSSVKSVQVLVKTGAENAGTGVYIKDIGLRQKLRLI